MRRRLVNHLSFTKPLRLVLILSILLLTLPQTTWGQTTYDIWIGDFEGNGSFAGKRVTSENANDVLGNGTVSYAVTDNVLTLNGANIQGTIYTHESLTIDLKGKNYITANDSSAITNVNSANGVGLFFKSTDGTGFLTMVAKSTNRPCSNGFNEVTYASDLSCLSGGLRSNDGTYEHAIIGKQLFSGGTGASGTPYLIATAADLKDFSSYVNKGWITTNGKYFKLSPSSGNTIDCTGLTGFEPISSFKGVFHGDSKTISNLTITSSEDYIGLFGTVGEDGVVGVQIDNLTLSNCTISGTSTGGAYTGGIAGSLNYSSKIDHCSVKSSIISSGGSAQNPEVGGIVGRITNSEISYCEVNATTITSSTNDGAASGAGAYAGGIAARADGGNINNCTTKGETSVTSNHQLSDANYSGAIIGYNSPTLSNNTYQSSVTTTEKTTTKSGQTQRGIGQDNDVLSQVQLDGTTMVAIVSNGDFDATEGTYYMFDDETYFVLPDYALTLIGTPTQGHKPRLTLTDQTTGTTSTIVVTAEEITDVGTDDYHHTEFTFTVGDANLTATFTFPIDIASASYTATIADGLYTGDPVVPTQMTLNDGNDDTFLTTADDFTITGYTLSGSSVDEPVNAGTYTVTVEGKNDYIGTRNVTYKIIQTYALTIRGTQVNDANKDDILGSAGAATASFTPATATTPNTLTLNGASFEGKIESGLDELTIEFTGTNSLNGTSGYITSTNNSAALTLKGVTNGTNPSTLSLTNTVGKPAVEGFASVTLNDGSYLKTTNCCQYVSGDVRQYQSPHNNMPIQDITFTTKPYYLLWIRDYQVSDDNKDDIFNDAQNSDPISATFNPSSNILTLNELESGSQFGIESGLDNLTISLIGDNYISASYHADYNAIFSINENATLTIQKAGDADCELELKTYGQDPVIKGFKSVSYTGLNFVSRTGATLDGATTYDAVLSSETIYPLWIDGTMVTEANKNAILGAGNTKVTYDGDTNNGGTNTLTLNNYSYTGYAGDGHAIETNITGLKVKLVGASTINCTANSNYAFYTSQSTASIQFVKDDATSKLTLQTTPANPFGGFADGKITYDGLVYYSANKYIAVPTAPTMVANDDNKVELTVDFSGGTIKYSIDYVDDETADVTEATYSVPFAMTAPGTVTAWLEVEANYATSSPVKGKYFGYEGAPLSMTVGETKTPVLIPAIETGDNIGYKATGTYESSATGVATFDGGTITAEGIGTATLTANIENLPNSNTSVVILNPDNKVTAEVNVGTIPEITFADGMEYATYCNTTGYDLTIPAGLKAYAVTGTNGDVVTLAEVDFLPKVDGTDYVALLLKREDTSAAVGLALVSAGGTRPTTNCLMYNYTAADITTTGYEYVLYKEEFLKATGTIPNGKCYLKLSGGAAPARASYSINHGEGIGTGIDNLVFDENGTEKWYDLRGRRIEKPTKAGLYIRNGEKIVVNDNNK